MFRPILLAAVLLLITGCERSIVYQEHHETVQDLIISGFGGADPVSVDQGGFRVGWYYDFTQYDSLKINFTAERPYPGQGTIPLMVKIGPAYAIPDTLSTDSEKYSLLVPVSRLAKPQFAALTFYVTSSNATVRLSKLQVFGFYSF